MVYMRFHCIIRYAIILISVLVWLGKLYQILGWTKICPKTYLYFCVIISFLIKMWICGIAVSLIIYLIDICLCKCRIILLHNIWFYDQYGTFYNFIFILSTNSIKRGIFTVVRTVYYEKRKKYYKFLVRQHIPT